MYVKLLTNNFLSEKAVGKSESKDVHLAVLRVLPEVIRESVDAERHADYRKGEGGKGTEGERRDAGRIVAVNQGKRDGSGVDADASSKSVIIYDPATGEKKMVSPTAVDGIESLGEVKTAEQREAEINAHMQDTIQRSKDWLEGNVANPVGMQIQLGDGRIATIEAMHEDGKSAIATLPDGTQFLVSNDVLQRIVNNGQYADYKARRDAEASKREAEQDTESAPETATEGGQPLPEEESREYAQGDVFDVVVDGNKMHAEIVSPKDADGRFVVNVDDGESMRTLYVTPEELAAMEYREEPSPKAEETRLATEDSSDKAFERGAQPTEEHTLTALERIPRDEKGNAQFHDVDTETAWDGLVEMSGNEETAHKVAEASLANAERKLKAAKALKEKGDTPEALLQSIKENEKAVAETEKEVAAWKAIVGEKARREEAAKAEAERIATEKAEAERKAAEERERAEAEEKTRIEAEKKEAERIAAEKAEEEARVEAERKAEEERKTKEEEAVEKDAELKEDKKKPQIKDVVKTIYEKGKAVASKLFGRSFFDVAKTPDFMKKLGLTGDRFTIKYGVLSRHAGKDASHLLTEKQWEELPDAIQKPFAITRFGEKENGYRLYTTMKNDKGETIVVGVDVKNIGRNLEVNSISTIFGRRGDAKITQKEEVLYTDEKITPEQRSLLGQPNSDQYTDTRERNVSTDKGSEKAEKKQEKEQGKKDVVDVDNPQSWVGHTFTGISGIFKGQQFVCEGLDGDKAVFHLKTADDDFKFSITKMRDMFARGWLRVENADLKRGNESVFDIASAIAKNEEKEAAERQERMDGYTADMPPMRRARVRKTLGKELNYRNFGLMTEGEFVESMVAAGGIVTADFHNGKMRRLIDINDGELGHLKYPVSKAAADYAVYLGAKVNESELVNAKTEARMHEIRRKYADEDERGMFDNEEWLDREIGNSSRDKRKQERYEDLTEYKKLKEERDAKFNAHLRELEKKQKKQSVFDKAKEIADKEEKKRKAEAEKPKQKPLTEAERKDAEEVAGALGYRVEWVDTMEENGTIDADKKVIRIAKDAENPLVQVLGHEVAHGVKRMDGGKFKALQKAAMEVVGEKEWNERIEKKRKLNAYAEGKLAEEVTCDIVGEALNDKDALKRLAESLRGERGILARLRDAVVRMVEYFKNRGDKEGVRRMKAADKLLAEFESALKDGDGVNESAREADVPTDNVGNIDFSHRTYHDHKDDDGNEHRGTRGKIIEYLNNVGMKKSDIGKFVDNMDYWYDLTGKVASLVDKDGHFDFPAFHEWSQTSPLYKKYEGNIVRAVSTLVSNGEYPLNFELSTDCIKREAFTQILNEMVDLGGAIWKNLTPAKIQELRTLQQSYGIQVACPLCFVEGKRLNIMKWATGVTDKWNETVRRVVGDEATPFGFGKGTYVPATPYNERTTPQEVTDQINEVARIVGSREGALPKDLARMQENTKAMEALLQQYYEDYVAKHGSAEGFSLSEAQLGELAKLRGKGASNVVDRMVDIIATHPELQHTLDVSDLVGSKGLMAIRGQSGDGFAKMYSLIVCANGTGTPKIVQDAQPYSGEILDVRQSKFDKAAEIGGARLFSFSDFDLTKTFDIMQIMWDCAARKAKVQSYSKEIPYILMFGKSGVKINMSMLPEARPSEGLVQEYKEAKGSARKYVLEKIRENAGLDMEGGHIVGIQLSDSHSVSKEFAESIYHNPDYNANCGAIMVGISVNHALYAMGQDYIRQVIPFHLSGMPISARRATDCQYYRDFTSEQNTGIIVNGRRVKQFDGGGKPIHNKDVPSDFDFYEGENEKGWDMRQRCRDYVKWCGENGLVPRFEWAVNSDNYKAWCKKKGYQPNQEIVDMMDAHTTDGVYDEYYKVITDFTAYKPIFDKDGNTIGEEPAPHRPVTGDFSMDDKTLGMVLGVDSEGRKVDDNSMLANRENTIKNADANKKEIAEKALLILNGKAKVEDLVRKGGEQFDNNSDSDKFFESSNEGIDRSVRESRREKTELTAEERELRDNLVERMRKGGLDVVTDSEEMQRVIDTENERTRESRKRRSAVAEERLRVGNTIDEAMAAATHLTKEEARAMRREWERKFKEETKELYGRVLSGNFDDVTLRLIDEFIDKSTPNNPYERPISKRLPTRALQKMRGGERTGSVDALFSRICESTVGKDGKTLPRAERERAIEEKKKELLKKWAIATGNWHTDVSDFSDGKEPIGSGTDSDVYLSKDGKSVIKVSKGKPYGKRFRPDVDNVALFNTVFPGSRYTIEGYGEIDGKFVRFLKQPFVDFSDSTPLTEGERVAYMEKLGFKPINKENTAFSNGEIVASDLQKSNVVRDRNGNVRVIDADMKLHTKDFGGKFSYPDAETDTRTDGVQRFLRTADGEVYGLVKDGRIYLDPKVATSETAVHEYTHLWGDMLRRKDSEQWNHTVKELKNSVLWEEVKELYPELKTDDEIADEVLSTFSGRRGAERLREEARRVADGEGGVFTKAKAIETLERVKEAIARFWEGVARMFGINRYRSAEELADMAMRDLLDSKNPMKDESGMRKRGEVGDEGVKSLKGEEAMVALDNIFEDKKTENMPQKVSSLVKFMELFRKPVRTFLGEVVNVKEEVYNKIIREKRTSISGAVLPTLENADFAIRDTDGSTLYIKRFKSENNDNVYNIAVVNKYGEVEDYVSSVHIKSDNNLRNKITKGAELLLPQERITDGILPRNNPTPTANVTNISEPSKLRFSRKPGESIFDYASRVSEDVDRSVRERVSARDEYEKKVKSKGFQTKEALQNSMLGLQEFMYAIDHASGNKRYIEDIPDFENPILGENRLPSVNKEEMHQVAKTQFKPLMSAVAKLSGNGKESGDLYDYMFAKHGLERDAVMRQREAQKEFDKYQKANPKGTKTIGDFVASLEGKDYAGLTALTAEDGRVKSIQSQIDAIDEQMKATDDQLLLRKLGGQKKRLKVDLLNAARDAADDIRKTFENNPSHDRSDINELWSRVNEVNGNTLRKLYESGLLTKEAYNDISSMYTNYIPMRGFDQTTSADAYAYLTHGDSAFNAPIKTAKGRSSKADNPIAYMQAMAESAIMQGNRNVLVKQKMLNFVRNHPSDLASVSDVWLQYDSVADEWKPVFPDNIGANDSASVVAKKMEAFEDKMKQMAEKHPDLVQRSNEAPDIPYKVVEKGQLNEHQVLVKQNGKSYIITVNGSPRAAQAANGLTNPDTDLTGAVGKVFEGAEALNRQLSSLYTTFKPGFVGSNYVRDALYSNTMVYVKEGAKYGGSFNLNFAKYNPAEMANLYARYNKGSLDTSNETHRLFLEFMQNGGETGFVNLKQIEKRKSEIAKAIKRDGRISAAQIWGGLSDAVDFANRAVENSARFAAYVTSRKSGRSVGRSVYDAKEISVNFNRKGSGRNWWKDNVGTSRFYDTEIGLVEINRASVGSSLAHRYSQVKLDVITSLAEGFNNAVYFGSMQDFSRQEGVKSHYFAYPINYNGNRNYVFCRAMQDANKSRLYVHEVFLADNIEKGNTLQTAASQPHGGITLYKDILANVLAANVTNDSETSKPCFSRKPGESIFDYASRVSEDVDRSVCEGR